MTIELLPYLSTERLVLRRFEEKDASDIYRNYASDPLVTRYLTWNTHSSKEVSVQTAKAFHDGAFGPYQWAVVLKETGQVIGSIGFVRINDENSEAEFGYVIGRSWWNKGIMTEALHELLRFGFSECGFCRITGRYDVRNTASGRVMEKCGLTLSNEGRKEQEYLPLKNETVQLYYRQITKEEWEKL